MKSYSTDYYVYVYLDPTDAVAIDYGNITFDYVPFYVGKGRNNRCYAHLTDRRDTAKTRHIQTLIENGTPPIIQKIATNLSSDNAYRLESELIKQIGTRQKIPNVPPGPLTNAILSGIGIAAHSEDTIRILSEKATAQWANSELRLWKSRQMTEMFKDVTLRLALSDKLKVICSSEQWLASKREAMKRLWEDSEYRATQITAITTACGTDEHRDILRARQLANWADNDYRAARTGVTRSVEAKQRMSQAAVARNQQPAEIERKTIQQTERMKNQEVRDNIANKLRGRVQSPETREKKRQAQLKRWARHKQGKCGE